MYKPSENVYYRTIISDTETGKIIKKGRWKRCRSFLLQYLQHQEYIREHAYNVNGNIVVVKNTAGVGKNMQPTNILIIKTQSFQAIVADATYGIVVGTGVGVVTLADVALGTQILHGVGAGTLSYGAMSYVSSAIIGAQVVLVDQRVFIDVGGGNIGVTEIGWYVKSDDNVNAPFIFCTLREKLGAADNLVNGNTYTVQFSHVTNL